MKIRKILLLILILLIILGSGIYLFRKPNKEKNNEENLNHTENQNPNTVLLNYDGKTIKISSADGKISGEIAFAYHEGEETPLQIIYFFKIYDTDLPKEETFRGPVPLYELTAYHSSKEDYLNGNDTGSFSAIFCNKNQMPDVLNLAKTGSIDTEIYCGCAEQYDPYHDSDYYEHIYSEYYNYQTFNYPEILNKTQLTVFNTQNYPDTQTAIQNGAIITTYELILTEK